MLSIPSPSSSHLPSFCCWSYILALPIVAFRKSVAETVPTGSISDVESEWLPKVFVASVGGNSTPEIFRARLLRVDLCKYSPPEAQNVV